MINYSSEKMQRVNRRIAERLYNGGVAVGLCPCKMNPEHPYFSMLAWVDNSIESEKSFESWCNEFSWYNCNNETGRYISFYIKKGTQA